MATMHIEHHSHQLSRNHSFYLILPEKMPPQFTKENPHYDRPIKTLFLLHGYSGSSTDWLYHTPAANLAMKYNLAVVFVNGDISFYLDREATGMKYCAYVGEELPQYLRDTFGIAQGADDTLIGGNSMGGFGAIYTALAHSENFGGAFGLSSALIVNGLADRKPNDDTSKDAVFSNYSYYAETFGPLENVRSSDNNPEVLVKRLKAEGRKLPRLYMACGEEDFLINENREFHKFLVNEKVHVKYEEGHGVHDWEYWNKMFEPALKYLLGCE